MEHQDLRGGIITKEEKSVGYFYSEEISGKHLPGKHDQDSHGGQAGNRIVSGETYLAAMLNYTGNREEIKKIRNENGNAKKLKTLWSGKEGHKMKIDEDGDGIFVKEVNDCAGYWVNKKDDGTKTYESEYSLNSVVKGRESEIEKTAAYFGKKFSQEAVIVAIHDDKAKRSGVFTLRLSDHLGDRENEAVAQHFVDAGLGGATGFLDKNIFKLVASDKRSIGIVRSVVKKIPKEFKPELSLIPARIRFIGKEEYDGVISRKSVEGESTADIFIMGVPPKESR